MFIAREKELETLDKASHSDRAEFIAIYGRRRVGKTFLVRSAFSSHKHFLEITGQHDASLSLQLSNFNNEFIRQYTPGLPLVIPKNWNEEKVAA